ncbi:MAG: YrdB family protein [Ktedonobacterales bacterium]
MDIVKNANLALAFLLELCLLAALGYWGFVTGHGLLQKLVLGLGAPLLVAVVWGLFAAPKAQWPLPGAALFALKALLFGAATVALWASGRPALAVVFIAAVALNAALVAAWHQ